MAERHSIAESSTHRHHVNLNDREARDILDVMEVDIMVASSRKEQNMVDAMDAFSSFVLFEAREECKEIIENHMGRSVGALQGGNDDEEIYRVLINDDEKGACCELIRRFRSRSREGKKFASLLTPDKFEEYMLGMCDRRSVSRSCSKCKRVNNIMFILTFGKTIGQVRHIDKMNPNLQVCLYMSSDCPSTIVYHLEEPDVINGEQLVEYWEETRSVPDLIKTMLQPEYTSRMLAEQHHTKFFSFWHTIDSVLFTFGKLYRPVSSSLSFRADPGTTLIAGGNEVHAGPPTTGPRMFAFAVGIPEEEVDSDLIPEGIGNDGDDEDNDGEIQYCPALLHTDLMCILFITMELEFPERSDEHEGAKRFLLELLLELIEDQPQETYERLLPDDRSKLRDWLGNVARSTVKGDKYEVEKFLAAALQSDSIFYSPDMGVRCSGKNKKEMRRARRKKKNAS
eukprot:jgi/Psemu1/288094/fgenesh1_pg.235_\